MKKVYQHPVSEIQLVRMQTMMSVPSVSGGTGIDNEPGNGDGDAPSGPGSKERDDEFLDHEFLDHDAWKDGLW